MLVHGAFADSSGWNGVAGNCSTYAGMIVSAAAAGDPDVKALVYIAAFAPLAGESAAELSALRPGSTLGETLRPVPRPGRASAATS